MLKVGMILFILIRGGWGGREKEREEGSGWEVNNVWKCLSEFVFLKVLCIVVEMKKFGPTTS